MCQSIVTRIATASCELVWCPLKPSIKNEFDRMMRSIISVLWSHSRTSKCWLFILGCLILATRDDIRDIFDKFSHGQKLVWFFISTRSYLRCTFFFAVREYSCSCSKRNHTRSGVDWKINHKGLYRETIMPWTELGTHGTECTLLHTENRNP